MTKEAYSPQAKTAAILSRALEIIDSVPYQVSARWVFYRLLQEGHYAGKEDYKNKFLPAISAARHAEYAGWDPFTLADETREAIVRGADGFDTPEDWLAAIAEQARCNLDPWQTQPNFVELWFEARAMVGQFEHYTQYATLRPMGGQPSIPFKAKTAENLEAAYERYRKPVKVLYFGDLDPAGETIAECVERDVRKWCAAPFEFIHCGLSRDQVAHHGIPENFEHPGSYQWEALSDDAAREIITTAMAGLVNEEAFSVMAEKESHASRWLRKKLTLIAGEWRRRQDGAQ
jgi:hypothetical protein